MNKKRVTLFIICNSIICLIIGAFIPLTVLKFLPYNEKDPNMKKFMEVYETIKDEWYFLDEGDEESYINRALDAMVNNQNDDKYLHYYPKEEDNKDRYGIGVTVSSYNGYIIIKDVYEKSPAKKANLTKNMIITKVDGVDIHNKSISEVGELISGPLNSDVILTCLSDGNVLDIKVTRSEFQKQTCFGTIDDGIATLRVTSFDTGTLSQFEDYLRIFKSENIDKLIIDLRDNGGGYIYAFKKMADLFIPKNRVLGEYIHKDPKNNEISYTEEGISYEFNDIVILVNENSASASESFTCAMKDNLDNVSVIGETTYGKGIAQKTISFSDGSSLKYTYAEYLRPNKEINNGKLHQIGVTPDIILKDEGNYTLIDKHFISFEDARESYNNYFNALDNLTEAEQIIIDKGKQQLDLYNDKIEFSKDVNNLITKLIYDEKEKSYEVQLDKVKDILKE